MNQNHCVVSSCQRSEDLFPSPVDCELLYEWKRALGVNELESFYVCKFHFENRFIETKKVLKENAVPSASESNEDGCCECCRETRGLKASIDVKIQAVVCCVLEFEVPDTGWICLDCCDNLMMFFEFKQKVTAIQQAYRQATMMKIKEEPDIAEIMLTQHDPFANDDEFIKEELPQEDELNKYEPEIKIELFSNSRNVLEKSSTSRKSNSISRKQSPRASNVMCLDCGIQLPPDELVKHRLDAHSSQFICDVCCRTYRTKNSLLKHIRHHIPDNDKQRCEPCAKIFINRKELIAHNNRCHSNGSRFICDYCEDEFTTRKAMVRCRDGHYVKKKSVSEATRPCPICKKRMKSNSIYSHIRLVHNNERDQICQICGKALKTSYDLKVHLRTHSGERPEICETCGKTFISYAQLYKHRKVRHMERENYQCSVCLKNVLSRFKLKCHIDRFHPNGLDNGIRVNLETNCYHCKICPLKFIAMHKYEKHLKLNDCQKFEGLAMEEVKMAQKGDLKGEFKCQECGSILNTLKGLKKHMRFVHPKEPQTCTICSKQLKNPHTLWQHMTLSHKQPVKRRKL